MKTLKLFIGIIFIISFSNLSKAEVKKDCSMIKNDTISGNLKYIMCKKGSDKLDKDEQDAKEKERQEKIFKEEKILIRLIQESLANFLCNLPFGL